MLSVSFGTGSSGCKMIPKIVPRRSAVREVQIGVDVLNHHHAWSDGHGFWQVLFHVSFAAETNCIHVLYMCKDVPKDECLSL